MKYDKIGYFASMRDYNDIALSIRIFFFFFINRYTMLFIKLNHEERKNEPEKGFSHHVKGMNFSVKEKPNNVNRKRSDARRISAMVEARMNHVNIKDIIAIAFTNIADTKRTNASKKAFTVRRKCLIVMK